MADYKGVSIDIVDNGYVITLDNGKRYIFSDIKYLQDWLKDNLSATGEVDRFSKALDDNTIQQDKNYTYATTPTFTLTSI